MCGCLNEPTCQDPAGDPWDALDLSHIVGCEVFVAGGVEERWVTKHAPQLGGDCPVSRLNGLGTDIKRLPHQSTVAQDAYSADKEKAQNVSIVVASNLYLRVWCSDFFSNDPVYSITKCQGMPAIWFESIQHYSSPANLNSKYGDKKVNTRALCQRIQLVSNFCLNNISPGSIDLVIFCRSKQV